MEINGLSGIGNMFPGNRPAPEPLTDEQKNTLQDILSNYDPENFTEEDAESLRAELEAAGIQPGKEVGDIMNEAGFEVPGGPPRVVAARKVLPRQLNLMMSQKMNCWLFLNVSKMTKSVRMKLSVQSKIC